LDAQIRAIAARAAWLLGGGSAGAGLERAAPEGSPALDDQIRGEPGSGAMIHEPYQ